MIQKTGADGQDRTDDLRFTKPLLYQLSYIGQIREQHYATFLSPRKQIDADGDKVAAIPKTRCGK